VSIENAKTDQLIRQPVIEWDPARPVWADCNRYHPLVDPDAYAAACGCGLLGVKVSEGGLVAKTGQTAIEAAEARGLIVVGYEYGAADPERFLELFPPKPGRLPCLDFEGKNATLELAEKWVAEVTAAYGRPPWFYAGFMWRALGQPEDTALAACPWWGAQYGPHLRMMRGVGKPVAWQFRGGSTVGPDGAPMTMPGIAGPGPCDLSALLCSIEELWAMAGALGPAPQGMP